MKRRNCFLFLAALAITIVLALPLASALKPVQAAVPWSEDPGPLSLGSERYVTNTWVVKNSPTDYEMWYSHGSTSLDLSGVVQGIGSLLTSDILTDLANFDLDELLNDMVGIDIDALWDFISASTSIIGYATSPDGINWTVVNPQVWGDGGDIFNSVGTPTVIKNGPADYEMWYSRLRGSFTKLELQAILTDLGDPDTAVRKAAVQDLMSIPIDTIIGYATSPDGINWTVVDHQIMSGDKVGIWDSVTAPCVVKNGPTDYEMWYTYANINLDEADLDAILNDIANFDINDLMNILDNSYTRIGYLTSPDGQNWTPVALFALRGFNGIWDSVGTPSVVKTGSNYEMWYTQTYSDLSGADITNLLAEIPGMELPALFDLLQIPDIDQFITDVTDLIDNGLAAVKAILDNTGTRIGYATSDDGANWTVQNSNALSGATSSPWSSVAFPCVIYDAGVYEMWFTKGVDTLTAQNALDVLQGDILLLGYATGRPGLELVTGWNFIGLPLTPNPTSISDILTDISAQVIIVWYYDGATETWSYYIPGGPPPTLTEMSESKGYWINLSGTATLAVVGTDATMPYDISLVTGWNLISLPQTPGSPAITDVLSDIIADVEVVWHYDGATQVWSYYIPGGPPPTLTEMRKGDAYWIKMAAPNTLTIDNS